MTNPHSCTAPDFRAAVVARVDARLAEVGACVRHGVVECPLCRPVGSKGNDDGR